MKHSANSWLPPAVGLLLASTLAVLSTAPPGHALHWPQLLGTSAFVVAACSLTCAIAMFLLYAVLPARPNPGSVILRMSAVAAFFGPFVILMQRRSLWAALIVVFLVWTFSPQRVAPQTQRKKFIGSVFAALLLQLAFTSAVDDEWRFAILMFGAATAPILWRVRQERELGRPLQPKWNFAIALVIAILSLTAYLPKGLGAGGAPIPPPPANSASGGKYRGVILYPDVSAHINLVVPPPMQESDPFQAHEEPIGIPFYGVYWFFQSPDKAPAADAYRVKGTPDAVTFHSADFSPLNMEARQNLGRQMEVKYLSGIDVVIRNADQFARAIRVELVLVNTSIVASQTLGALPLTGAAQQTVSFKIPPSTPLQQFDELAVRFPRAQFRATRSAKIAVDRFFLIPRR